MIIKMAYYRKKDWKKFLKIIDDRENVHDEWEDWYKESRKAKDYLKMNGFEVIDVKIDLNELINFCKMRGIKNDGKARSQFVQK